MKRTPLALVLISVVLVCFGLAVTAQVPISTAAPSRASFAIRNVEAAPNPFDPGQSFTTISYDLSDQCPNAVAGVTGMSGGFLRVWSLGSQPAGSHTLPWDARSAAGIVVGEGLYVFYVACLDQSGSALSVGYDLVNISPAITNMVVTPRPYVPGAGTASLRFSLSLGNSAYTQVVMLNAQTSIVKLFSPRLSTNGVVTETWDGKDNAGNVVPNGRYLYGVIAVNPSKTSDAHIGLVFLEVGQAPAPTVSATPTASPAASVSATATFAATATPTATPTRTITPVPTRPSLQKGMSFAAWWAGAYASPDADLSLAALGATGANWISVIVTGYQDAVDSTTIRLTGGSPTDDDLIHAIQQAHSQGLKVMLKPHVDVLPDASRWRGEIGQAFTTETQWAAWFASYRSFVEHYASLAQTYGVEQFSVGCEYVSTTHRESDWRSVVAAVRARYKGPITYAANWGGEETSINWWDAVDYIGVDAYYPLTNKNSPTISELMAGWSPYVSTLANLSARWRKPILITEIGYRSVDGANQHPWDWLEAGVVDLQEQADTYRAALQVLYNQSWLAGIFWWMWDPDPFQGGPCDNDYTPHDKPAEDVLRAWYGAPPRPAATPTPAPDYGRTLDIYTDALGSGWQDWSWGATRNLAATGQVYSGTRSISASLAAWGALSFWHPAFDASPYTWLEFYVRGSAASQPLLTAYVQGADGSELRHRPVNDCRYLDGGTIDAGVWKRVRIPLSDLNAAGQSITRISIQDRSGGGSPQFWVDALRLLGARPSSVSLEPGQTRARPGR